MKRVLTLILALSVCVSLCVNVAFASDVITASVDQNILVYFPWFGGVCGSSANRVTNYATVTTSDVTTTSDVYINQLLGTSRNVNSSANGITITGLDGGFTVTSFSYVRAASIWLWQNIFTGSGHKYLVMVDNNFSYYYADSDGANAVTFTGNTIIEDNFTGLLGLRVNQNVTTGTYHVSVIDITALGIDGTVEELTNIILSTGFTIGSPAGQYPFAPVSSFSLVPAPAANGGSSTHQINDYTWYQYEADITLDGNSVISGTLSHYMYSDTNDPYVLWGVINSINRIAAVYYTRQSAYDNYSGSLTKTLLSFDQSYNYAKVAYISIEINPSLYPYFLDMGVSGLSYDVWSNRLPLGSNGNYDSNGYLLSISSSLLDYLDSDQVIGYSNGSYIGTFTIDRIFRTIDSSYFLFNNQVNLGTYDFNVNVKFPSLEKFNNFSGYWMASFNTSWGEIPVRTQVQEVSSNSDTLIKIYKLTFDVPFTGQYTKFNIKYVGDSSAFTTIRVDASVIDPNGYTSGAGPTTINGLSFYLTSMFDKFWGKVRSLFFDQDQIMAESVPSAAGELAEEVSSGAETIHEFETNNFDSIETQQENIDWDIPDDFGSSADTGSAIGFVSMLFMGIYQALGVKVQYVIVVPLILGLVLLVLGRGSLALGKLVDSLKR